MRRARPGSLLRGPCVILAIVATRSVAHASELEVDAWLGMTDQTESNFGWSVSPAGDINGDGFDDVVVGAPAYDDNRGAVFAFYGSASGLSTRPDWQVVADQASAHFGWSVSDAGDVNGDGFDDVVVGAEWYDHGEENEGATFVYFGSSTGLQRTSA